eukprot:m.91924 g.91924  ORF g.91924 m.91924 type:complete len:440 (+) comp26510_c0_seq2:129-1448(+)
MRRSAVHLLRTGASTCTHPRRFDVGAFGSLHNRFITRILTRSTTLSHLNRCCHTIHRRLYSSTSATLAKGSTASSTQSPSPLVEIIDGVHPVINVSSLIRLDNCDNGDRANVIQAIGDAFRQRGYFYARGVDCLPEDYIDSIYEYSKRLHSLPIETKQRFRDGKAYTGQDAGKAEHDYDKGTVSTVRAWDYSRLRFTLADVNENSQDSQLYPQTDVIEPPYEQVLDTLYERQNVLGSALLEAFGEMLGLQPTIFKKMFEQGDGDFGTIRLLRYPGGELSEEEAAKANIGISAHTDFEAFTLMHQDAPGLQFMPANGDGWIDAPVRPKEFVVIVGDVLERFTNGMLKATPHRVALTPHARCSIIRFNGVAPGTIIAPLPQFITEDRPPAYSWVTMRTHMETTMKNLEQGLGSWDAETQTSTTATYKYVNGADHRACDSDE